MLVVLSLASLLAARKYIALAEYATVQRSAPVIRKLQGKQTLLVWVLSAAIIGVGLLPHIGILLSSFSKVWSFTLLPTVFTLGNFAEILFRAPHFLKHFGIHFAGCGPRYHTRRSDCFFAVAQPIGG